MPTIKEVELTHKCDRAVSSQAGLWEGPRFIFTRCRRRGAESTSASGAPDNTSLLDFSAMARPCWLGRAGTAIAIEHGIAKNGVEDDAMILRTQAKPLVKF